MRLLFLKDVCLFWCSSNCLIICAEEDNKGSCCFTVHHVLCLASCVHTFLKQIESTCRTTKCIFFPPVSPALHSTMKLNFPMGTVIPCFINFSSQFTSLFIQFKILSYFLLRAKGFTHCSPLHFCLFIGPVPRNSAVTLWCTPAQLRISLILWFHWLYSLIYIYRHKHTSVCRGLVNRPWLWRELLCRRKLQDFFHAHLSKMLFHHTNLSMLIPCLKLKTCIKLWTYILALDHQLTASLHLRCTPW